jgi:O-antigen/teichoic acid export membrane protein
MSVFAMTARRVVQASHRQVLLLTNSGALVATGVATAALGFMFWWFAARYFPPHAVGLAAAAISIMSLVGLIGEFGLATLLMGESRRRAGEAPGLISAALFAALASSTLFGVGCLVLAGLSPLKLGSFLGSTEYSLLFIAGCAVTGFMLVLDGALVGLLQSALRMYRHVTFSLLKLALLPALAFAIPAGQQEIAIFLAWVLGTLLSGLFLVPLLAYRGHAVWSRPNFATLQRQRPSVLRHHLLDLVTQGPGLILPFLVTVIFAADVNAAFYAAWMIFIILMLVPASLTTMLFAMGSAQPTELATRVRFSLWLCALASLVAGIGTYLLSGWVLGWFGPTYAATGEPILQILGLGVFAVALKQHYIAVQRLKGRMMHAAMLLGAGGVVELALAVWGAQLGGLSGFTWGWVGAIYLEAMFAAPVVLRAARRDRAFDVCDAAPCHAPPIRLDQSRRPARSAYVPQATRVRTLILRRRR